MAQDEEKVQVGIIKKWKQDNAGIYCVQSHGRAKDD